MLEWVCWIPFACLRQTGTDARHANYGEAGLKIRLLELLELALSSNCLK